MSDRDNWGDLWEEPHEHAQPGDEGCGFGPSDDEDDPGHLLDASAKEYVTVHDYVSAVHPWSMSHFDVISSAANVWEEAPAG
ncbi:Ferric reductase, NAD binding protein [Metarhizium robertsii ARSEF 23]|uniref:Ferric reductase, NAD binding protein n=1 Tax=Metarhizium robertsii (strain ARSEF 23 / ATCC MYA-3075) TaxID=655844 RepID=A0A0B2XH20_METRA|nr:Ferric reductase, NAD binding protein [Metarhizium robertsii ARSEF 23]KHO11186.1 Ferric reductase, NAD binding protein [Metarhizium robertsii ARSEF 23]